MDSQSPAGSALETGRGGGSVYRPGPKKEKILGDRWRTGQNVLTAMGSVADAALLEVAQMPKRGSSAGSTGSKDGYPGERGEATSKADKLGARSKAKGKAKGKAHGTGAGATKQAKQKAQGKSMVKKKAKQMPQMPDSSSGKKSSSGSSSGKKSSSSGSSSGKKSSKKSSSGSPSGSSSGKKSSTGGSSSGKKGSSGSSCSGGVSSDVAVPLHVVAVDQGADAAAKLALELETDYGVEIIPAFSNWLDFMDIKVTTTVPKPRMVAMCAGFLDERKYDFRSRLKYVARMAMTWPTMLTAIIVLKEQRAKKELERDNARSLALQRKTASRRLQKLRWLKDHWQARKAATLRTLHKLLEGDAAGNNREELLRQLGYDD